MVLSEHFVGQKCCGLLDQVWWLEVMCLALCTKVFPIRLVLRSVLFLTFAVIAHLTRAVLSEQVGVGVGGWLSCVVHWNCF